MGTADDARAAMSAVEESAAAIMDASGALVRRSGEITGFVGHDLLDRRADQPAGVERRHRGRARRRERPGFAVVADEVRKLAEQSAEAAALDQRDRHRHLAA